MSRPAPRDPADGPLAVRITGWSPFVPLEADSSSLPVAGLEYELTNRSDDSIEAVFSFHAANATGFYADGRLWDPQRGDYVPRAVDPREVTWEIMRKGNAPVLKNSGAEAWDLGDGVLGLTFKTKANSIDADVIKMIHDATARAEQDFRAM